MTDWGQNYSYTLQKYSQYESEEEHKDLAGQYSRHLITRKDILNIDNDDLNTVNYEFVII